MFPFFTLPKGQIGYRIELLLSFRCRVGIPRVLLVRRQQPTETARSEENRWRLRQGPLTLPRESEQGCPLSSPYHSPIPYRWYESRLGRVRVSRRTVQPSHPRRRSSSGSRKRVPTQSPTRRQKGTWTPRSLGGKDRGCFVGPSVRSGTRR